MISVRQVAADDPDALALWKAQERDLAERYDEPDLVLETEFPTLVGSWVGDAADGTPVASVVARWSPYPSTRPGDLELKRLWVEPDHRGHGHARVMMGVAEAAARRAGATRIILETGTEQPEAIALYERIGYDRMTPYGEYKDAPDSVCFAKELPTRVLIVNGTIGAGKTTTSAAVHDVLTERGARSAYIDADFLCQAEPPVPGPPYNQDLLLENLAAVAPNYRRHGYGLIVMARVVEDPRDRDRHARAFRSDAGPAEVSIVRVTATEETRMDRIRAREPEGTWQDWGFARTVELEDVLEEAGLDDAVVINEDRDRLDTAREVMASIGW